MNKQTEKPKTVFHPELVRFNGVFNSFILSSIVSNPNWFNEDYAHEWKKYVCDMIRQAEPYVDLTEFYEFVAEEDYRGAKNLLDAIDAELKMRTGLFYTQDTLEADVTLGYMTVNEPKDESEARRQRVADFLNHNLEEIWQEANATFESGIDTKWAKRHPDFNPETDIIIYNSDDNRFLVLV